VWLDILQIRGSDTGSEEEDVAIDAADKGFRYRVVEKEVHMAQWLEHSPRQ